MHGPRKYRRGSGGGGCPGPSATSFFSHQLHLRFFLKKTIIFQDSREGPTFSGGGGGGCQTLPRAGWGGSKYLYSKFLFGEVYRRIYGRKFSFTATRERSRKT